NVGAGDFLLRQVFCVVGAQGNFRDLEFAARDLLRQVAANLVEWSARVQHLIALNIAAIKEQIDLVSGREKLFEQQVAIGFARANISGPALARMQIEGGEHIAAREHAFSQAEDVDDPKGNRPQWPERRDGYAAR